MSRQYFHPYRVYLSQSQMNTNASAFASYLLTQGWTIEAICGALGNWQSECTLNPNYPQRPGYPTDQTGGMGLPQWTPWGSRYGAWLIEQGIDSVAEDENPAALIENQIAFHEYSCAYGQGAGKADWYSNHGYNYTWLEWKQSLDDPGTLARAYYWQYERSAAESVGERANHALEWYNYLDAHPPGPWEAPPVWLFDYVIIKGRKIGGKRRGRRSTTLLL